MKPIRPILDTRLLVRVVEFLFPFQLVFGPADLLVKLGHQLLEITVSVQHAVFVRLKRLLAVVLVDIYALHGLLGYRCLVVVHLFLYHLQHFVVLVVLKRNLLFEPHDLAWLHDLGLFSCPFLLVDEVREQGRDIAESGCHQLVLALGVGQFLVVRRVDDEDLQVLAADLSFFDWVVDVRLDQADALACLVFFPLRLNLEYAAIERRYALDSPQSLLFRYVFYFVQVFWDDYARFFAGCSFAWVFIVLSEHRLLNIR